MSYTLKEIKLAAYNWNELPNMTSAERSLWQGLGYANEQYRCGENKELCDDLAQQYVDCFERGMMGRNDPV